MGRSGRDRKAGERKSCPEGRCPRGWGESLARGREGSGWRQEAGGEDGWDAGTVALRVGKWAGFSGPSRSTLAPLPLLAVPAGSLIRTCPLAPALASPWGWLRSVHSPCHILGVTNRKLEDETRVRLGGLSPWPLLQSVASRY